jgi:hypothetical protein
MEYHVQIEEALVLSYLSHPDRGLSEADLDTVLGLLEGLPQTGEAYRNDLSRRRPPDSYDFEVTYVFEDSAGKVRAFRFIVSDAAAVYGVLRVRFAEEL